MNAGDHDSAIRLGLIGDAIHASQSPALHRLAGAQCGLDVRYDLLIPPERGEDFETVLAWAADTGLRGVNITYPYKEWVCALITIQDPAVARLGACNTVLFDRIPWAARGDNTDYTGFLAAWRARFGETSPGRVALIGTGGVGRAIGFALAALGARELILSDAMSDRATRLASDLQAIAPNLSVNSIPPDELPDALRVVDGAVNATPIGMVGKAGCPVPGDALGDLAWAFDAVYTPVDTEFLSAAGQRGARILSGWELFFHQGLEAFRLFTGRAVPNPAALRQALGGPDAA